MEEWVGCAVQDWLDLKLISDDFRSSKFYHRFNDAWRAAGRPDSRQRSNRFIVLPEMYEFLKDPIFISIASQILRRNETAVHGIFNLRPQVANDKRTLTPMHQDGQFWDLDYGDAAQGLTKALTTQVATYWFPLCKVTGDSGCILALDRKQTGRRLFSVFDYNLIFDQLTPHAASNNLSDRVRWSVNIRSELAGDRAPTGTTFGFIASHSDSSKVTSMSEWLKYRQAARAVDRRQAITSTIPLGASTWM